MILLPLVFYVPAMAGVFVWNVVACVVIRRRRDTVPRWARRCCYLAVGFMVPGLICDIGAMAPGDPIFRFGAWLYPASFWLAAAATVGVQRPSRLREWLSPMLAFDALMGWVYLARRLLYVGVPLGPVFDGQQVAYSVVQTLATTFLYVFFPILNWWPVAPIPRGEERRRLRRLRWLPSTACALIVVGNVLLTPRGIQVAASWHAPRRDAPETLRSDFRLGVVVRVSADPSFWLQRRTVQLSAIRDLRPGAVNLFVHDDLMRDTRKAKALEDFVREARRLGAIVILTADYPSDWPLHPPGTREEVLTRMLPYQRFLASRFAPDYLIPYVEPYGAFVAVTRRRLPASDWMALLSASASGVRQANAAVQCAVYLGQTEDDRQLYERACAPGSPVDVVGFSFYSVYETREEMAPRMAKVSGWIREHGAGREHWVFEFGQSPLTMGGERSQRNYLEYVSRWASNERAMDGACVFSLDDEAEKLGLMTADGRQREAYRWFREAASRAR